MKGKGKGEISKERCHERVKERCEEKDNDKFWEEEEEEHIGTHRKNKQQQAYWPLRGRL